MSTATPHSPELWRRRHGVPRVGAHLVRRERLLAVLEDLAACPVVCVQAPGGYGKTSALAQWAGEQERPVVWLTVRPQAPDTAWLVDALTGGLRELGLLDDANVLPAGDDTAGWYLVVLPALERRLAAVGEPFVVVIDEAGAMSGEAWEALVLSLAQSLPEGSQLVLATRGDVPSSLQRLRGAGSLFVLGPDDLALDAREAGQLLHALAPQVPHRVVMEVLADTQGWPIAVYLAGKALADGDDRHGGRLGAGTGELAHFLRAEILARLPDEDAAFLLRISVLTQLDEPSCLAVTAAPDTLRRLRQLAEASRLVTPLDTAGTTFRMHPLLAAFLSEELRATDAGAWRSAHAAASLVREAAEDLDAAVYHARLSGDDDRLGALVWSRAAQLISRGQTSRLRRWLEPVGDGRTRSQAELALTAGYMAAQQGDATRTHRMLLAAESLAAKGRPDLAPDVDLLSAVLGRGGPVRVEEDLRACIAAKDPSDAWLTLAFYLLGALQALDGHAQDGARSLESGLALAAAHELPLMRARLLAALSQVVADQGDAERALDLVQQSRDVISDYRLEHYASMAPVVAASARAHVLQGHLPEAKRAASAGLQMLTRMHSIAPWQGIQAGVALAEVLLALGDVSTATTLTRHVDELFGSGTGLAVLDRMVPETRARVRAASRTPTAAEGVLTMAELRVLQYLPTHLSYADIASRLYLSPHTVKTQALSVFRKVGAHSRTEAIDLARERGLLPEE